MADGAQQVTDEQVQQAADYIRNQIKTNNPQAKFPKVAIVCGSGLSKLGDEVKNGLVISYDDIPNFPTTTVCGHKNQMIIGSLGKCPVIVLMGRFHFYEGLSMQQCTMYVRVLDALDIEFLVISNAAGGINPDYKAGDIMFIKDHIFMGGFSGDPLLTQDDTQGFTFKNKQPIYEKRVINRSIEILQEISYEGDIRTGIYACLSGPNYETIAELKFLRTFGADAVGMSTVPEALVAYDCGIQVLAFSLITNECIQDYDSELEPNHAEVVEVCSHRSDSLKTFAVKLAEYLRCCCICPGS